MGRVLAVDWGTRRVGVAVSDETRSLARSLPTLNVTSERETAEALSDLATSLEVDTMVVGNPMHMSGREGTSTEKVQHLIRALERRLPGVTFVLWDERLSSRQAEEILKSRGEKLHGNRGRLDQVAAAVLLQSYLDSGLP